MYGTWIILAGVFLAGLTAIIVPILFPSTFFQLLNKWLDKLEEEIWE